MGYDPNAPADTPHTRAHAIVERVGLRIWRHRGTEGVNVHDEAIKDELVEAGCNFRPYQPEQASNPTRLAWECILPNEYPVLVAVEEESDDDDVVASP